MMLVDTLVGVPSDSGGAFGGCQLLPAALRAAGLDAWPVRDDGNLQIAIADPVRDGGSGMVGFRDLVAASHVVRDGMHRILARGGIPLVLGGDCTLLIGTAAALQSVHPDTGLIFVDGHFDTWSPTTSTTGDAADMEMAIVLGDGPDELTGLGISRPLIDEHRVVFVGPRDHEEMRASDAELPSTRYPGALVLDEPTLRVTGVADAGRRALDHLGGSGASGHWLHVDVDVLSSEVMAAVDYPQPGGLSWAELGEIVIPVITAPGFRGMSIAILNPTLPGGSQAIADTADWLRTVLTDTASGPPREP